MNLRERFEAQNGRIDDELFHHVLALALDDQRQYMQLSAQDIDALMDPVLYPPNSGDTVRLDEIRERLLETMAILLDIVGRRKLGKK